MDRNYIEEARILGKELAEAGLDMWQKKIEDGIVSGATGNEIAMAVRFNIKELLQQQKQLNVSTLEKAQSLIVYLDKVLK